MKIFFARYSETLPPQDFSKYDMVEQMEFLYVNVVKARELPVIDISTSVDPYVEVQVGNYQGTTSHFEKNQCPVWNNIFAFSKEKLQSDLIEVTVKHKDVIGSDDDFVGKVSFDIRVPPNSPLAPQWYKLVNKNGEIIAQGEIMLAVWIGTQADEAFPQALHCDAHTSSQQSLIYTRSKVYRSPKFYYLRVQIIEAQDLVPPHKSRKLEACVKIQFGHQVKITKPSRTEHPHLVWNEELMFVASEPFEGNLIIDVVESIGPGKDERIGRTIIHVRDIPIIVDIAELPNPMWFKFLKYYYATDEDKEKKEVNFWSKIHLRVWIDAGHHFLDEATLFSSDLQPSSENLRKASIGILELGILNAKNLPQMKGREESRTTDAYCVAKYGNKWARTRTLFDTLAPRWNEQFSWEVFDPCTVITIVVIDKCHINGKGKVKDQRIGKVRIRISTLETDRVYMHLYPLLFLAPSGLRKHGELHLAIRFTCTDWMNMVTQYGRPLNPKMHYVQPIPIRHIDWLRHDAMQITIARLAREEPPLSKEVVEYMLEVEHHMFSLRRMRANLSRIKSFLSNISAACLWFDGVCYWKNPLTSILVHVLFVTVVCYPVLILPTIFLSLFVIGLWNYRFRPRALANTDARLFQAEDTHADELDEEFDTFPTSRTTDIVRLRYDRLRILAMRMQMVAGDFATQGERALAIVRWRDPRATTIFTILALICAVCLYITPFRVMVLLIGLYWMRHPRLRSKLPSVPVNLFNRLPDKSDMFL